LRGLAFLRAADLCLLPLARAFFEGGSASPSAPIDFRF
jgi:hypothetical protein